MITRNGVNWFIRPTLAVVVLFLAVTLIVRGSALIGAGKPTNLRPTPSLSPADVVRIQLGGLTSPNREEGIETCYAFASPGNRAVVRSSRDLGEMLRQEPYQVLTSYDDVIVGTPILKQRLARVVVTVVHHRQLSSFVWVLSRQTAPPYRDCWMTDGVFLMNASANAHVDHSI